MTEKIPLLITYCAILHGNAAKLKPLFQKRQQDKACDLKSIKNKAPKLRCLARYFIIFLK
ncbi:MAG: hypothetical protein COB36_02080 [Alphaproteobacteria bacterium]|nr:MAG: hypothetical protein COB36_02080 [Alphaproteobacteria bacterium]